MKTLINNSNTLLAGESFKNEDYCEDCNISYYNKLLDLEKQEKRLLIHSFHRYFGKLIPAIPRFSIKEFTKKGDIVMDPFCGSGTTLVESMIQSRYSYGLDLNPLSCLISNTKTSLIEEEVLLHAKENLFDEINSDNKVDFEKDTPFCINMTHWFKPFVIKDLVVIKRNIDKIPCGNVKNFFLSCLSSILRDVSNADPRHIFPGYSKRLRAIDETGGRLIDVLKKFELAIKKRIEYLNQLKKYTEDSIFSEAIVGDARNFPEHIKNVKLIVTNPPYISSIRYLEVAKLEMYWLNIISSSQDYLSLDKKIIGTERFYKAEYNSFEGTGDYEIDIVANNIFLAGNAKMSKTIINYFNDMKKVFFEMYRVLVPKGHVVIKISDSFIRNELVPTHRYFIDIAENIGFKTIDIFKDKIENRSLLTKRNYYSGIITHDWILIFQKR